MRRLHSSGVKAIPCVRVWWNNMGYHELWCRYTDVQSVCSSTTYLSALSSPLLSPPFGWILPKETTVSSRHQGSHPLNFFIICDLFLLSVDYETCVFRNRHCNFWARRHIYWCRSKIFIGNRHPWLNILCWELGKDGLMARDNFPEVAEDSQRPGVHRYSKWRVRIVLV